MTSAGRLGPRQQLDSLDSWSSKSLNHLESISKKMGKVTSYNIYNGGENEALTSTKTGVLCLSVPTLHVAWW